jgi:PAS domain S-box-containing protein
MYQTDSLLKDQADITMLLSPQNVVFASNKEEWIGRLAGKATPERIRAIREIKQFGNMFDNKEPLPLPIPTEEARFEIDGGSYAAAKAKVAWNDPLGDWTLVAIDDLSRVIPLREPLLVSLSTGLLVLLLVALLIRLAHSNYARTLASHQLEAHARDQAINAERKDRIAGAAVRMQRAKSMLELSQVFLDECHVMFGALQGALYVAEEQNRLLRRVGSYACAMPPQETILYGEGLLGQCAVERRLLIEFSGTGIFFTLRSGLGETQPAALLIAPALLNEMLLGVTEIALLHQPQETDLELFKDLTGLLAMNIEIISRHTQTAVLLSATRAEDATLTEQLHFQQALVDTIPYPVFYKGPDTRFLGFNRAYEETFKVRREDLIGKRVLDLDYLPEADRLAYQAEDEATIASVGTVRRALKIPFADGKLHNTMYFVSGFRQPDGSPGGLVGTFIDMGINDAEQPS